MISLYRLKFTKRDLASVPIEEKILYFMLGEATNSVSVLSKQILFWLNDRAGQGEVHVSARTAGAAINVKLLAGVLYEAWQLLAGAEHSRVFRTYSALLDADDAAALAAIKVYFNRSDNLVKTLRRKLAFHNDYATAVAAFNAFPEDEQVETYIAEYFGNMFNNGAHLITAYATTHLASERDLIDALNKMADEVLTISNLIERYGHGFSAVFARLYLEPLHEVSGIPAVTIDDAQNMQQVCVPYFITR